MSKSSSASKNALYLLSALSAATLAVTSPAQANADESVAVPAPATRQVGSYFAEWGVYDRDYEVADIVTNKSADKLTFINYAFANIYKKNGGYECDTGVNLAEPGATDPKAPNAGLGGDAWAAYSRTPKRLVGSPYKWDDKLAGNFGEFKQLKKKYPNIKLLISLGGWTWSKWFSDAAKTPALRKQLVASCIKTYLKGDLVANGQTDNRGGPGAAAGVFDGIDVDWEYPVIVGQPYNTHNAADKQNFTLLLKEFRTQLDAYGKTNGNKHYLLTAAISAGKDKIDQTEPGKYIQYLDWVNLMAYDFHGGWEPQGPTDFQSNLYVDPASPNYKDPKDPTKRSTSSWYNTEEASGLLVKAGVPANKIILGVPFYGRGWTGVKNVNKGLYQAATGPAKGTYEQGIDDYRKLKPAKGTVYTHAVTKQSYKFDGTTFWSYDTPAVIKTKIAYLKTKGFGGIFSWSLDGDDKGELLAVTAGAK